MFNPKALKFLFFLVMSFVVRSGLCDQILAQSAESVHKVHEEKEFTI